MRLPTWVAAGLAGALALSGSRSARADKAACFDAAERAQLMRHQHDLLHAREALITCSSDGCPAAVRRDCTTWLAEVDVATPSITIHAKDARGHDVIDARVILDGAAVRERLDGIAIPLNPGEHTLRLESQTGAVFEDHLLLTEGQKERLFDATFQDPAPAVAPPSPAPPPKETSNKLVLPAVLGGVAIVGLGLATYFELAGQSEYRDLRDGCAKTGTCGQSAVSASQLKLDVLAPVTFGVGLVSLATGVALLLVHRNAPSSSTAAWQLDVAPVAGHGVEAVVRFRM